MMVGEMCSPRMQARVMSYLALGDAMGNILGELSVVICLYATFMPLECSDSSVIVIEGSQAI